ncbi:MAG: hypothetical protein KGL39_41405 [Patescibacteria group bacterium]|nr:hypothetical protein [Patescibacteria group bacterium]
MEPTNPELILIKSQKARLLAAKVSAMREDGLPFYHPHKKQDIFHRSPARRRGAFTGNRFGKSTMGCAEDCAWLRGERCWLPKDDPARTANIPQRPVKGLIITTDWDKVKEIWTGPDGKLWKFLPKKMIKMVSRNHSGAVDTVAVNGPFGVSTVRFDTVKSYAANPQGSESSDWDFIHIDEPCPEGMWKAQSRGLVDRNGYAWFTLTALREPWITDAFDVDGIFAGHSFFVEGSIYDNPYLTKEAISLYEASLTPDEKECRLYGKPLHKAGLVYKSFQQDKHVLTSLPIGWRSFIEPPIEWSYYLYIDPHPHTPHMVLFLVVDPFGRKYYYYDIFSKCLISQLCAQIKTILGARRVVRVRCDPIAFIEDPVDGQTMASEFFKHGIAVEKASKDLSRGILRVNEALASDFHPYFTPECRRALWEIKRYHWDEETGKPIDADDHAMECLYRSILDEPCFVDQSNNNKPIEDEAFGTTPRLDLDDIKFDDSILVDNSQMRN